VTMMYELSDLRLPLAFRVGVTGRRKLKSDDIPLLRAAIEAFLAVVRSEIAEFASTDLAKAAYRSEERGPTPFALRVASPLAEGADRLVAEAGLAAGAELNIPLPFPQPEYEKDFPSSVPAFRALLAKGHAFALDGLRDDNGPAQAESYEAVGRFVVRNSDFLIAIWDGKRERGQGGTGQIVSYALRVGMPVWWTMNPERYRRNCSGISSISISPSGLQQAMTPSPPYVTLWACRFGRQSRRRRSAAACSAGSRTTFAVAGNRMRRH
jgi:hypothetical protein